MAATPCIIVSGPSGVGKTTITQKMLSLFPQLTRVITTTTRAPRPGEKHGIDYFFVSQHAFSQLEMTHAFLEVNTFGNASYGTPRSLLHALRTHQPKLILPDITGTRTLVSFVQHATTIWLTAPLPILAERLAQRSTESIKDQEKRLAIAAQEIEAAQTSGLYAHHIDMTDFAKAEQRLIHILRTIIS
jgi:guanylate kinase